MKLVAAGVLAVIFGVMLLPAVLLGGDDPGLDGCGNAVDGDRLAVILTTIRTIETGGNYETRVRASTASGAYGFIDRSWRHYGQIAGVDTARYPSAWMAPPADQDAVAAAYVNEILTDHDGRVEIIPLAWYLPSAINDPAKMDVVPPVGANVLTPRQYQTRWMAQYERELQRTGVTDTAATATTVPTVGGATSSPSAPSTLPPATPGNCIGGGITPLAGDWSLPGPRTLIDANPDALDDPHHDYPAWDWIIDANTPIYAVRGGHVDTIRNWPHNWWSRGCGQHGGPGCDTCGIGVTIVDDTGHRWTYCHGTNLTTRLGDTVTAGQQIMWSGNTGRSGTAHLHLEIRTNGTRRCPQPLLESLYHDGVGIDPVTLPHHRLHVLTMDTPLTLDEMRTAVGDLTAAFLHHQPLTDHQWDQAISTLLTAREQHGGRIRRLIHVILDAGHPDHPTDALPDALDELHCHLAIADDPPAPNPPPETTTRRQRRNTRPADNPHSQLSLFATGAESDPATPAQAGSERAPTRRPVAPTRSPPSGTGHGSM